MTLPPDIAAAPTPTQRFYKSLLRKGNTPRFAEMLALRKGPHLNTDTSFMAGRGTLADQLGKDTANVVKRAREQGYNPSANDVYFPTAARRAGDPAAFVKQHDARSALGRANENIRQRQRREAEKPPVRLAPDIVEGEVTRRIADDPALAVKDRQELREAVIEECGWND